MRKTVFIASLFVSLSTLAIQEIEVVVADQSFSSSSKVVITEKEIKKSQANNLSTLLSTEANIAVVSSNFTPNSIYIRGGDTSHVLFLIDGIPYYDPSTIQRTVNLSTLNLRSVKRVEIIKGSQSVLYGGKALAGVIKIETFPSDIKTTTDFTVQGGKRFAEVNLAQQFKLTEAQGFAGNIKLSDAHNKSPVRNSSKTYPQRLTNVDLNYTVRDILFPEAEILVKGQYTNDQAQINTIGAGQSPADAENFDYTTEAVNYGFVLRKKDSYSLAISQQQTDREFDQDAASGGGVATNRLYEGVLQAIRLDVNAYESNRFKVDTGASFSHEELYYREAGVVIADVDQEFEGIFVKGAFKPTEKIVAEAGARQDFNRTKAVAETYQVGLSYSDLLKLEYSTGFNHPSLFQQFNTLGYPELKPEKVTTLAATVENQLADTIRGAITFFESKYDDLITFQLLSPTTYYYKNVAKTETKGVEVYFNYDSLDRATNAQLSLGYQEPKDFTTNTWLARRPLRTASLKVNQEISDKTSAGAELVHTGSRRDGGTTLPSYNLIHLVVNYQASQEVNLFARAENIFSQEYQSSYRYYVDGPVVRAGLNYTLE